MSDMTPIINALFQVESSSTLDNPNWGIRGPRVPSGTYAGERAIGPAQIMPGNIPEWSERHLGQRLDPDELARGLAAGDPQAKAAYMRIVEGQVGSYAEQGYDPQEIAVAWHSGPGGVERMRGGRSAPRDTATGIGTFGEGDTYVSRFTTAMGQTPSGNALSYGLDSAAPAPPTSNALSYGMAPAQYGGMDPAAYDMGEPVFALPMPSFGNSDEDDAREADQFAYRNRLDPAAFRLEPMNALAPTYRRYA